MKGIKWVTMAKNLLMNLNLGGENRMITDGTMMTSMGNALRINRTHLISSRDRSEKGSQKESRDGSAFGMKKALIGT